MTTITTQLAEAARVAAIAIDCAGDMGTCRAAIGDRLREALAAYDARQPTTLSGSDKQHDTWRLGPMRMGGHDIIAGEGHGKYTIAQCVMPDTARRIVACSNACAGIPTDALETMPLREAVNGVWQ